MAKTLYKYEASSNKFVWFTTWDRALRNYYTDDYNYVPDPVVGNPYNTFVEFRSRKPGMANVDWGDAVMPLHTGFGYNPVKKFIN